MYSLDKIFAVYFGYSQGIERHVFLSSNYIHRNRVVAYTARECSIYFDTVSDHKQVLPRVIVDTEWILLNRFESDYARPRIDSVFSSHPSIKSVIKHVKSQFKEITDVLKKEK